MKKTIIKKVLICFICIFSLLGLIACQNNSNENENTESKETIPTEISASFDSVEAFKVAVKKDPSLYNGKRVSVKGYSQENLTLSDKRVWLYDDLLTDDQLYDGRTRIRVIITDSDKLSVIEDGDYVDLNGVVTITLEETLLDSCAYTMIKTNEEQK